nr:hypothetical protein Iba_chr02aCG11440 [Ipomoea batatas]
MLSSLTPHSLNCIGQLLKRGFLSLAASMAAFKSLGPFVASLELLKGEPKADDSVQLERLAVVGLKDIDLPIDLTATSFDSIKAASLDNFCFAGKTSSTSLTFGLAIRELNELDFEKVPTQVQIPLNRFHRTQRTSNSQDSHNVALKHLHKEYTTRTALLPREVCIRGPEAEESLTTPN